MSAGSAAEVAHGEHVALFDIDQRVVLAASAAHGSNARSIASALLASGEVQH